MEDTYEHAKKAGDAQVARELAVRSRLDALEEDVLGIWDDYMILPYGSKYDIHVRTDLSISEHNRMMRVINSVPVEVEGEKNPFTEALVIITLGLHIGDQLIQETGADFWDNPNNWSMLKVQQIIRGYLQNYKQEMDKTTSFLDESSKKGDGDSQSSIDK